MRNRTVENNSDGDLNESKVVEWCESGATGHDFSDLVETHETDWPHTDANGTAICGSALKLSLWRTILLALELIPKMSTFEVDFITL